MIWVRSALFNASFFAATALMGAIALPLILLSRIWVMRLARSWSWVIVGLLRVMVGVRIEVTGRENLPAGPLVVASKHQSAFDTVIWFTLLSDPAYVLKQELLRIPIFGWHARAMGMIPVDRAGGGPALRGMLRRCAAALAEGRQVVIFPEGTRSAPGTRPAYQPGIVAIAGLGAAPLVPVATDSGRIWPRRGFLKHPGVIRISILPPLAAGTGRAALLPALEAAIETESARLLTLESCG
jgi:1-acyl-sn-glycerol-3-phosphate acyltransferase